MKNTCAISFKYFVLLILFSFIICSAKSQIPNVRNYTKFDYNAANQNWSITQSINNKIYIANGIGMLEFDSNKWNLYPISNFTDVRSLYYDIDNDRIYGGAFNEFGYYVKDEINSDFKYISLCNLITGKKKDFKQIWKIHKTENTLFFQGENEIFKSVKDSIIRFDLDFKIDYSTVIQEILFVASTYNGISMLNGNIFMKLPGSEILNGKKIAGMIPYIEGNILIITANDGIFRFDGNNVSPFQTDIDSFIKNNQVFCTAYNEKYIALGTVLNGVVIKDLKTNNNTFINKESGLQDNTVLSLGFDKDHNLWLGLNKGVSYIYINSPISNIFSLSENFGAGYTSKLENGTLYLGTNQGLFYIDYPIINSPVLKKTNIIKEIKGQVWFISKLDNHLFCGNDGGLFEIKEKNVTRISGVDGVLKIIELKSHPNYLLGCSYHGFFILEKINNKYVFRNYIDNIIESSGRFFEDKDGNIWFSHWQKGIYKFKLSNDLRNAESLTLYNSDKGLYNNVNAALSKINNEIIINSDGAFLKYDESSDELVENHFFNKYFGGHKSSVELIQSPDNSIWAISNDNIYYATYNNNSDSIIDSEANNIFTIDSISYKSILNILNPGFVDLNFINNNRILISTENGFSTINIVKDDDNISSSTLLMNNIIISSNNDTIYSIKRFFKTSDLPILKNKDNSIRFEYVLPEFRNSKSVHYSYFLEGFDKEWSEYSDNTYKEYTNLPGGKYTFHVKSLNSIFVKTDLISYPFIIESPWYFSKKAYLLYTLILILFILFIIKLISIYSEKASKKMEIKKEAEIRKQEIKFIAEKKEKEKQIIELKNQQLHCDLRHKSQELANSTMNLIRKNEVLTILNGRLEKVISEIKRKYELEEQGVYSNDKVVRLINSIRLEIRQNIEHDNNWTKFENNFDIVYEDYIKKLSIQFPQLNNSDKKLCAYLKMNLSSKDIAPLMNMSVRSVEMARYRLRKKMELNRDCNLSEFLQKI